MNKLEEKCALLATSPQARWYDLRYKPTVQLLLNMQDEGTIKLQQLQVPLFQMMNIIVYVFKYDREFYFLFVNQMGRVTECFHLERTNSHLSSVLSGHMIISSDDDLHQEMYITTVALCMGANNNSDFISKLNSML